MMLPAVAAAVLGIAVSALGPAVPILGRATVGAAAAASTSAAIARVALVIDGVTDASAKHGLDALRAALKDKGIEILEDAAQVKTSDFVIVAGVGSDRGVVALLGPESLTIRKAVQYQGKPALLLAGGDGVGLMYAALDTAERVTWAAKGADPFQFVQDVAEKPFLKTRGVVIFTMNKAYFENRLYDERFWTRYFDMFAKDRLNELVVTFGYEDGGYMAPPYPYFFDVEGFPNVRVVGLTKEQQDHNRASFEAMLRLAGERGIRVKAGIWEHIYRGGGQMGAVIGASDGKSPTPGLVWGVNTDNLVAYTVAALKKFYQTFPGISETQFRMHDESGLRADEIEPFWHQVFGFFKNSNPKMPIELRAKGLAKLVIKDAQSQGLTINLDTKIWMEQMGLPYSPSHVNKSNQMDARHSYADLLEYPQTYRMNWTLWNGGTDRLLLWGDPEYARRLAIASRLYDGQTLAVTEMEATKLLGERPDAPPRDFVTARYRYVDYEFERYWSFYRAFGRMAYNPESKADVFDRDFVQRFGDKAAPHIMKAQRLASQVLPHVVATSYVYRMFPTTMGWAEMEHQGSLPQFAQQEEGSDISQFENLRDEATSIIQGTDTAIRRPQEISRWFSTTSEAILAETKAADDAVARGAPLDARTANEFQSTMADARVLAAMARYHAARQIGGVYYNLYKQAGDLTAFDQAIERERKAVQAWQDLVDAAGDFYVEDIAFGTAARGFPRHWKDELKALHTEFDQLLAERKAATGTPGAKALSVPDRTPRARLPVVTLQPAGGVAVPGQDFVVSGKATAAAGVKWMRLRYRHVNQKEDFATAEMTLDAKTGLYSARIPGAFVDPQWDLMYFVEVVDRQGSGRIYPDVDVETPYVIVSVKR
jgi:hypothetical protein